MISRSLPLDDEAFAGLMAAMGPFEPAPRLALAVSGGADSMALALLASRWATARGGAAVALIVDHRLRPDSSDEARLVAGRCAALGVEAGILVWQGARPVSGIEAAARRARHALLERACVERGILHLLLAHHADDQAETVALRCDMASGPAGLAGMSSCVERAGLRVLRPLLPVAKARLVATVQVHGLDWVEDPMNRDPRFARARLRLAGGAAPADPTVGEARVAAETALAGALAEVASLDCFGAGQLDRARWHRLDRASRMAVLARFALCVGGAEYAPRGRALGRLADAIVGGGPLATTLGGCHWRGDAAHILVTRELRHAATDVPLAAGVPQLWDGRFSSLRGPAACGSDRWVLPPRAAWSPRWRARSARCPPLPWPCRRFPTLKGLSRFPTLALCA